MSSDNLSPTISQRVTLYVERCDMLINPFYFHTKGKNNGQTLLGGILSLMIIIFAILYLVQNVLRQLGETKIIYAGSQTLADLGSTLHQNDVRFVIRISSHQSNEDIYFNPRTQQYVQFLAKWETQRRNSDGTFKSNVYSIPLIQCNDTYLQSFNLLQQSFTKDQWKFLLCPNLDFDIYGSYHDLEFSYLSLQSLPCIGEVDCKSQREIEDFIEEQQIDVDIFIQDARIKNEYIGNPIETTPYNIYWRLDSVISNTQDIYITPLQIDLKSFSFFEYFQGNDGARIPVFTSAKVDGTDRRQGSIIHGEPYSAFYIRVSQQKNYYFIINDDIGIMIMLSLSEMGGLVVSILAIFRILYAPYSEHKRYEALMNSTYWGHNLLKHITYFISKYFQLIGNTILIFRINQRTKKQGETNRIKKKIIKRCIQKTQNMQNMRFKQILSITFTYPFIQFLYYEILHFFKFYFGCTCDLIRRTFFHQREEELAVTQLSKKKIEYDLCLANILRKLYEIDCLKLYLFDDEQLVIFNSFSQPVIQQQGPQQNPYFRLPTSVQGKGTSKRQPQQSIKLTDIARDKIQSKDHTRQFNNPMFAIQQ